VTTYCEKPHSTNIDLVPPKSKEVDYAQMSMWDLWKEENGLKKKKPISSSKDEDEKSPKYRHCSTKQRPYRTFHKLSWATMGYQYDWTARTYHDEDDRSPVPSDLEDLAKLFAATALLCLGSKSTSFVGSACIVNYYNTKSIMGGHRDDSEYAIDKPIVSFSAGRPAVFLLGGPTRDDDAIVPILVRPGDVMMMGGDCRLNYHAMARLLPLEAGSVRRLPSALHAESSGENTSRSGQKAVLLDNDNQVQSYAAEQIPDCELDALRCYLAEHRININLRQVYRDDGESG